MNFKTSFKALFLVLFLGLFFASCEEDQEQIPVFTVLFDTDGGTAIEDQEVVQGKLATRPTDPTKEGYNFVDWFNGEESFDFNTAITTDVALTAKWKIPTGETTVVYNTISQADFEAMTTGQHAIVKAELNYLFASWAWGTEVFLVDEKGNSSKDFYGHSSYGMFTFPLTISKEDPMIGSTFVFNLVKDTYMSSPQLGFAYERSEAYNGSSWTAPMRYGIEFFDEIIRGNVKEYAYTAETGVTATIGETVISFKTIVEDNDGNVTYEDLTEADLTKFDGLKGLNKYVYTITVDGEVISVLNDDALQVYDGLLAE